MSRFAALERRIIDQMECTFCGAPRREACRFVRGGGGRRSNPGVHQTRHRDWRESISPFRLPKL